MEIATVQRAMELDVTSLDPELRDDAERRQLDILHAAYSEIESKIFGIKALHTNLDEDGS